MSSTNQNRVAPLVTISQVAPSMESLEDEEEHKLHIDRRFQRKESIISSEISLYVAEMKPRIPDGGWGWLVVLACFYINMISDGVGFTFGLLFIEFLHEFKASKSATSWIGSLFMAIPLIAGPIGSALVDKYGCQSMTVVGGLICTVGFVLSSYAKSIGVMYITFGIIGGLGLGLCFVTAVVSIAFWFEKRRTVALGLAASGTGFGTVVFSPLSTCLLFEFGWRGTLLIVAGLFANMCVCGMLMRDPDWINETEDKKAKKLNKTPSCASSRKSSISIQDLKETLKNGGDTQYLLQNVDTCPDLSQKERFFSAIDLPTFLKQNETVPLEVLKQVSENKQLYNIILENYPNLLNCKSISDKGLPALTNDASAVQTRVPLRFSMKLKKTDELQKNGDPVDLKKTDQKKYLEVSNKVPLLRSFSTKSAKNQQQAPHHSYLKNIRFRRNSMGYRGAMLNIHKYKLKASSCPNVYRNSYTTLAFEKEDKWYDEFLEIVKDLSNVSLFLELHFLLLSISTIILFIWFIVPYFYLADHMQRIGYTETEASFIISVIGFTNTIGMILLGWAGDRLNVAKTYATCLILCGLSVASMMLFSSNYVMLIINGSLFGVFFASCLSLTPSLLAQLVPLDEFTMAYGLFLLCQGIGNLTGPPLAGFLFDVTQSWEQSFYQAGFWIIISGLLIAVIPFTENRRLWGSSPLRSSRSHREIETSPA
ncbi:monocarboxylate transporter 14-like [Anoplophora glabripennis]|uniref:monocarboxylate transporter 14-like n=1 Tax=Anoplophora glabripennis TaxID=217634 RepID=UPI000874A0DB|nr:monocarboxylate transporter 14-like [Anoplophora glabripennis]XP_018575241.1 monocarboxylate transporter 14-like [Anoplophora glabripennis]XP_018575242.1 monocarboxylate transporter 14-like [Anoplophora glabripennis]XP_018575243.1 monocarboxylate transporter 14-like [Anoplophora glabripennis]XP_018575244.1 monocarboxylate transporter 14-like [Anoplophora glabripennis]